MNHGELARAEIAGKSGTWHWRKQASQTTGAGIWYDMSMASGSPGSNFYAGAEGSFTPLTRSNNFGLPYGPAVMAPATRYLRGFGLRCETAVVHPFSAILMDYLGFYGFVLEAAGRTDLDNSTTLTRYTSGDGVRIMPVVVVSHVTPINFRCGYTNSQGVSGRLTPFVPMSNQIVIGTVACSGSSVESPGPFMPLQAGDTGVRQIDFVEFADPGQEGLLAFVLVKPIDWVFTREATAPIELDFYIERGGSLKQIQDDAFLGIAVNASGTLSGAGITGYINTINI